jgi:hypothetical protein
VIIPPNKWMNGKYLNITFMNSLGELIDTYNVLIGENVHDDFSLVPGNFEMKADGIKIKFIHQDFNFELNKNSGLLGNFIVMNDTIIRSGPHLNLSAFEKGDWATKPFMNNADNWQVISSKHIIDEGIIRILTNGIYNDSIYTEYIIDIDGKAKIRVNYNVKGAPSHKYIRESGISFVVNDNFSKMSWERDSYWSAYPDIHLGMPVGEAELSTNYDMEYREYPANIWEFDNVDFFYHGIEYKSKLTNIARSTKENIFSFILESKNGSILEVKARGDKGCRLSEIGSQYLLNINDKWDYGSLMWGNYQKNINFDHEEAGEIILQVKL